MPVSLAFLWHLHQPIYRLRGQRLVELPWVRLHAIRSYYDMVRVLDEFPGVRVTINLVPGLIDQIRAYTDGGSDLFWEIGAVPAEDLDEGRRRFLVEHFFSAQRDAMIGRLPRYFEILEKRDRAIRVRGAAEAWREFSTADLRDLQALFDLAWFGFRAREDWPVLRDLRQKGRGFTQADILAIHAVEREVLGRVVPLYREAAARGQAEITTSPFAHPILPLLADSESAREAMPGVDLPPRFRHPEDARLQIEEGLDEVERRIGLRPRGLWPSEGSVSQETAALAAACGLSWAASDEEVLRQSDRQGPPDPRRPWRLEGMEGPFRLLFRDHDLSDRIGFRYARMPADQAATDLIVEVLGRGRGAAAADGAGAAGDPVILVALDGENPWEHYPRAGADFLRALYGRLETEPEIACRTVSEALLSAPPPGVLRRLRAGSWIDANFSIWIGDPEKNRAWSLLGRARAAFGAAASDLLLPGDRRREAWESIRAAEGSDWFWWLDGRFESHYRPQFDQIFRGHLRQAWEALGKAVPEDLAWSLGTGLRRGEEALAEPQAGLSIAVNGFEDDYFEWQGAAAVSWASLLALSTMGRAAAAVGRVFLGFTDQGDLALRLDPARPGGVPCFPDLGLEVSVRSGGQTARLTIDLDGGGNLEASRLERVEDEGGGGPRPAPGVRAAARKIFEMTVPRATLGLAASERAGLRLHLRRPEEPPAERDLVFTVPAFPEIGRGAR